jgi:hypothetical protein
MNKGWKTVLALGAVAWWVGGCAAEASPSPASDESALTEDAGKADPPKQAAADVIGERFVSGHCGHSVEIERGKELSGPFVWSFSSCEDGSESTTRGTYAIEGTTVTFTSDDASVPPWSFTIDRATEESDPELPPGTPILRGDAAHGETLIPAGFLS